MFTGPHGVTVATFPGFDEHAPRDEEAGPVLGGVDVCPPLRGPGLLTTVEIGGGLRWALAEVGCRCTDSALPSARRPLMMGLVDPAERRKFVRDHRTCIFGYGRRGHGPAMTVVYYVMDGDDILVSTMAGRQKARAVARDPRVSLCVLDEQWPPTYLQVYGTAELDPDPARGADLLRRVVELMAGEPVPDERRAQIAEMARTEERVVLRVRPYATFATPPRHVHAMDDLDELTHWTSASLPW